MAYGEERDAQGNYEHQFYSPAERAAAGVSVYDSRATEEAKVSQHRYQQSLASQQGTEAPGFVTFDTPGYDGVQILKFGLVVLVLMLIGAAIVGSEKWWRSLPSPMSLVDKYAATRFMEDRRERFSHFAPVADWPKAVQVLRTKRQVDDLETLLAAVPRQTHTMPRRERDELASAIWFTLSAHGAGANEALWKIVDRRQDIHMLGVSSLTLNFLRDYCKKDVEVACLDVAKAIAGLVFVKTSHAGEQPAIDDMALKQLPTKEKLGSAPAIIALRNELSRSK